MSEHPLREDIFKILSVLASRDDLSQRGLSSHLGISLGKTNYMLKSLAHKGLVKIKNFTAGSRKINKVKYILTKEGLDEQLKLTYLFLRIKEGEYLELKREYEKNIDLVGSAQGDRPENEAPRVYPAGKILSEGPILNLGPESKEQRME
ncbi:MAG: MarR family EPS-associated transcriptional regulator [Candidatus Omnitrophica bacterium]|nr:MarR family EPS-associated transcriptional regulator [Candidatus Omnitrophota bacterium]